MKHVDKVFLFAALGILSVLVLSVTAYVLGHNGKVAPCATAAIGGMVGYALRAVRSHHGHNRPKE